MPDDSSAQHFDSSLAIKSFSLRPKTLKIRMTHDRRLYPDFWPVESESNEKVGVWHH
jgi:hypothetical protein